MPTWHDLTLLTNLCQQGSVVLRPISEATWKKIYEDHHTDWKKRQKQIPPTVSMVQMAERSNQVDLSPSCIHELMLVLGTMQSIATLHTEDTVMS